MAQGLLTRTGTCTKCRFASISLWRTSRGSGFFGSQSAGQRPTHLSARLPECIAKQVLCRPDSYSKQEPSVRSLWPDTRMMVFPYAVDSPFCNGRTNITVHQSNSLEDREIGRRVAPLWRALSTGLQEIFLERDAKYFSLFLHWTHVHKSPACWIVGTGWRNQFSRLHHPDTNSRLILLLLTCTFLVLLMMFCDKSFVKPASWLRTVRPMRDGRFFATSPFRRLASRGSFFAISLPNGLCKSRSLWLDAWLPHDSAPRCGEDSQHECSRPHDTFSCFFYTALWLGQCKSTATQMQQLEDIDMAWCRIVPMICFTCSQVGPMSFEWPAAPPGGFDQSTLSPSREDLNDGHVENADLALPQLRWRQDALQPPELQRRCLERKACVHIPDGGFRCVAWNAGGGLLDHRFLHNPQGKKTELFYSAHREQRHRLSPRNSCEGWFSTGLLFRYWPPKVRLYGTIIPNNLHAVGIGYVHP